MHSRPPYVGSQRRLVLAFDLGTTFSGVSYTILDPGKVPTIQTVSRFPGQEKGDSKIPTIIHYDEFGHVLAVGAEEPPIVDDDDEDDGVATPPLKLEWFKLLLRPSSSTTADGIPDPQLPSSKTVVDVYADFYGYLFARARDYIKETHMALGGLLWDSVKDNIDIVLSHPNGWHGSQQNAMRSAAIKAGLVRDTEAGHSRITFVTEGEASLHYCIANGLVSEDIKTNNNVMIIDAGGGTVDLSTYTFQSIVPITVQEVAAPECVFEGSVIVRQRAENHFRAKLRNSKFGAEAYIISVANEFDKTAKKRFKGTGDANIKFSNLITDRDPTYGIRNGQLKLSKDELCSFFDPGIEAIIRAVEYQRRAAAPKQTYLLVGGFAASDYLFSRLRPYLEMGGSRLFRPDTHTGKAVAEGAVSFHIDHFVSTRIARFTYGTDYNIRYAPSRPEHVKRSFKIFKNLEGNDLLPNAFSSILAKGTQVAETTEFRRTFYFKDQKPWSDRSVTLNVIAYRGDLESPPEFVDQEKDCFFTLCNISGLLKGIQGVPAQGPKGIFYCQEVEAILSFGLTELQAQLAWKHNGKEHRSPAAVVYDDDFAIVVPKN